MASVYKISETCRVCFGSGVELTADGQGGLTNSEQPCEACGATGKIGVGEVDLTDLEDKLDDVIDKLADIKEKLDEM